MQRTQSDITLERDIDEIIIPPDMIRYDCTDTTSAITFRLHHSITDLKLRHNDSLLFKPYHPVSAQRLTVNTLAAYYAPMTTALAFQTAYRQITPHERSFVDWLVDELVKVAKRIGQRISLVLNKPLPDALRAHDTRGYLDRPLVRAAVTERIYELAELEEISPQTWIREVHSIAHANMDDILQYDEAGDPYYDLASAPREYMAAIKSVEVEKSDGLSRSSRTKVKITMHDKVAALKMEAAYMGLDDGDNPHRRADKAATATALPASATAEQAGDAYAAMIGDD